jgi:hypothetical protein
MATDHINVIERKLIDNLRTGTYRTTAGLDSGSAWDATDVTVFGQFPITENIKYPAIVVEQVVNGIEEQFIGQGVTSGSSAAIGEIYGVGFNIHLAVDKESSITVGGTPYKQRRLLNYLMLNCANVIMDCDFSGTSVEILQRNFAGFRQITYDPDRELWVCLTGMVVTFLNTR